MSSPLLISNSGVLWSADMSGVLFFDLRFWEEECKCDLSAYSCVFSLYGLASNMDSHNHVIGLVGSAFNEGVLLDTNH